MLSAPQVVGSLLSLEEFASPVYNQIHQEQIVAGKTTQNIVEIPTVQEHVIVQEIPQVTFVDWTPEQIVEPIEVLPQERVELRTSKNCARACLPGAECRNKLDEPANLFYCC